MLIGHTYGGIYSPQINPFAGNVTSSTNANSIIYEVWLVKDQSVGIRSLNGENPFKVSVFPNPAGSKINMNLEMPYTCSLDIMITDINGKLIYLNGYNKLPKGKNTIDISDKVNLADGIYNFNFVFDGKFSLVEKVIVKK